MIIIIINKSNDNNHNRKNDGLLLQVYYKVKYIITSFINFSNFFKVVIETVSFNLWARSCTQDFGVFMLVDLSSVLSTVFFQMYPFI